MSEEERRVEQQTEQLLHDHEQASEEARYRDRLIYNSYYLAVIVFFLLAQSTLTIVTSDRSDLLPIVFFSGGIIYLLLTAWALGVRDARNNAWQRKSEIESKFDDIQTNEYTKLDAGEFKREKTADSLSEAIKYAFQNFRTWSDIPDIVSYADPDFISWFLIPLSVLFSILSIFTLVANYSGYILSIFNKFVYSL